MPDFLQLFATLREQTNATASRSDILRALIWPIGIIMTGTVGLVWAGAPTWLLIMFSVVLVLGMFLYGGAYIYSLIFNPDSLRSETYSLHKMAIEHGIYGDSRIGLIEPTSQNLSPPGSEPSGTTEPTNE